MLAYKRKLSLLVLFLLPTLLSLGFWQLARYHQKMAVESLAAERLNFSSQSLSALMTMDNPHLLPVTLKGHFLSDHVFFLDNQIHRGQAGVDVIMPFVTDKQQWLLVNRGWLPLPQRNKLPSVTTNDNNYLLTGRIQKPLGQSLLLAKDDWGNGWPKLIQSLDFQQFTTVLKASVPPWVVRLDVGQPAAFEIRPLTIPVKSDKHLGYAIQWFTMALVLLGLYAHQIRKKESSHD
ncbi:SURF1 family protein [Candidatus Sororendozoicomonas aggregata]|uniref:SURF1 family protein n=1 Tax=Candidatus Sororendozoicomonas aggregata TaxID=3073239 RepID=UPI002ED22CEC